jgi:hypothetical protein
MNTAERVAAALLMVFLCGAASAADIYRWVDDKGVTNLSDVVPEKYRKTAQKVEAPVEPDDAARRDAATRAAAISSAAASGAAAAASSARRGSATPAGSISPARAASGAGSLSSSGDNDDCATLQRRYKESQECFGPQPKTISGAINGARSPQCPVVVDPSPKCGLPPLVAEVPPATAP